MALERIDSRILELMASRLCHEFVGPVGAVANGVELIEETNNALAEEALGMVGTSARELASRIKFYRVAYGFSGLSSNNLAELRSLALAIFENGNAKLNWPMPPMAPQLEDGEGKLVLNMIALAKGALSRSGEVLVDIEGEELIVKVQGKAVGLAEDLINAITGNQHFDEMTPRNVHGFWSSLLARRVQRSLRYVAVSSDEIQLKA